MLTSEQLDTAAVYGDNQNLALRRLGMNGRILNPEHAQDCVDEIAAIVGGTDVMNGEHVSTDWLMMPGEFASLVDLAFACKAAA